MSPGQVVMDLKKMSGYYNDAVKFVERHKIDIGPADDMKNQNKDDLGVRDSEDAPTSTSGNAEADGTCPVDDMKNQNKDDLGVRDSEDAHYNPYHATSNESGSEAKRFMCSTSSCASIVYDSAYDDILAIGIAAKNICHEDIRKNVSSSDAASNSTVTNSTTSYIFDINFSSNMSYHEMINIISDSLGAHNDMLGY
ncbi:hypothetical protein [Candidatus Lariskella endosymbiont of Epinotia ramella]|uniref:hypothetical protein n=1 Tax=Candidatus Lariskella endosymbiont of Epinotia ramella TaxID=3066224 RepID=UPI0030CD7A49